jgi:hypothetical protein
MFMVERGNKAGLEVSMDNYVKAATTLAMVVENISKVPIPEETLTNWELLMSTIRVGDSALDGISDDDQRRNFKETVVGYLRNEPVCFNDDRLKLSMDKLREMFGNLTEQRRDCLLGTFDSLLEVTERLRHTQDREHFSLLVRLEGQLTARLFLSALPDEYKSTPKYHHVVKAITRIARLGNVVDSFSDLPDDYRENEVKIRPTFGNRVKLLSDSIPDAVCVFKHIRPRRDLIKHLVKDTLSTLENNSRKQS